MNEMAMDTSEILFWRLTFMEGLGASHCYLRGPSDSITLATHCDSGESAISDAILFVNYIFGLLLFFRTLLIFQPMTKISQESPKLIIPKHLAVNFTDDSQIYVSCLADIILHSVCYGIERLTFFDPWCVLASRKGEIIAELKKTFESKSIQRRIVFDDDDTDLSKSDLRVIVLGANDGRASLVRVCQQLCDSTEEITIANVYEKLASQNIYDPDFMILVGNVKSLAGYPPWSLRVTELLPIPSFKGRDRVKEGEFRSFLESYSKRDRRLGK